MDAELLLRIDGHLSTEEVEELKFLCRDHVPQKQLESVEAAVDLFRRLEEQGLLGEDNLFLAELLLTIRRLDLLRALGTSETAVMESLSRLPDSDSRVSPYRKMLYDLSENVTEETLRSFKFLLRLPRSRLDGCKSFLDVLVQMEKRDLLREDSVEELQRVFNECNKVLAAKVQEYAAHLSAGGPIMQSGPGRAYPGSENSWLPGAQSHRPTIQQPSPGVSLTSGNQSLSLDIVQRVSPQEHPEDYYKTSSRPLGYCLIINNFSFKDARMSGVNLRDRKGTDRDAELLQKVFSRLHFQVEERKDLTGEQLRNAVCEFGKKNHQARDAFVCCVLSHGEKGSVHATDGISVPIRALTLPFTSTHCPSLALKPKLFFIQACQGQDLQRGALIQADGAGEEEEEKEEEEEEEMEESAYSADASSFMADTIPDDSDFLLGMATVEDYKSFRSITQGSIFIQELCRQLVTGCQQKDDILSIMTRVNREVSSGVFLRSKQMPEPRYTLRKKLVLPID